MEALIKKFSWQVTLLEVWCAEKELNNKDVDFPRGCQMEMRKIEEAFKPLLVLLVEQQQSKDMRHWSCRDCGPTTAVWRGHPVCSTCGSSYITSDLLYERKELQVVEQQPKTEQEKRCTRQNS